MDTHLEMQNIIKEEISIKLINIRLIRVIHKNPGVKWSSSLRSSFHNTILNHKTRIPIESEIILRTKNEVHKFFLK